MPATDHDHHVDNDHSTGGDDINDHNYIHDTARGDVDLNEHFKFYDDRAGGDHDLHHFNLYQFDYFDDDDVHCPEQLVFHYNDTEYVLVRRDHLDNLRAAVDQFNVHHGAEFHVVDAARTLVDGANAADAATPGHGG